MEDDVEDCYDDLRAILTKKLPKKISDNELKRRQYEMDRARNLLELKAATDKDKKDRSDYTMLESRKPLMKIGLQSHFKFQDYSKLKYTKAHRTLLKAKKAYHLREMQQSNRWGCTPTAAMIRDFISLNGWKGSTEPTTGLHVFGFVPISSPLHKYYFDENGLDRQLSHTWDDDKLVKYIVSQNIFVPTSIDVYQKMLGTLLKFTNYINDKEECIMATGYRYTRKFIKKHMQAFLKLQEKNKWFVSKFGWYVETTQQYFVERISDIIKRRPSKRSPLKRFKNKLENYFKRDFQQTFGRMHSAININLITPAIFHQATVDKAEGKVIRIGQETADTDDDKPNDGSNSGKTGTKQTNHFDRGTGGRKNPNWLRLKDPDSWATVFDKNSDSGKKNLELLPQIRHHTAKQKDNTDRYARCKPCVQFYWNWKCQKGTACPHSHQSVLVMNAIERHELRKAVKQINDNAN